MLTYKEHCTKLLCESNGISMSGVRQYLDGFAQISAGKQGEFWKWQAENAKPVKMVHHKSIMGMDAMVDDFIENCGEDCVCQVKQCYSTAYEMAKWDNDIDYVEGYVQSIIPLQHAWNYHKPTGQYFDLMNDITWSDKDNFSDYHEIIKIPADLALQLTARRRWGGGIGELIQEYYMNQDEDWVKSFT